MSGSNPSEMAELRARLETLERRLAALERAVALGGGNGDEVGEKVELQAISAEHLEPPPLPVMPIVEASPEPVGAGNVEPRERHGLRPHRRAMPAPEGESEGRSLEEVIGKNWVGWIGAIVVVLGVLFFIKYAWDQGWLRLSPTMRVLGAAATGMAVSAIGHRMHSRGLRGIAATLHGTGLAVVMGSIFGAYAAFDPPQRVLNSATATVLTLIVAAAGAGIALHINSIVVAALALVGAMVAPLILGEGADDPTILYGYVGVVTAATWWLGGVRPRWILLQWMALVGSYGWMALWWFDAHRPEPFTILTAGMLALLWVGFVWRSFRISHRDAQQALADSPLQASAAMLSLVNTAAFYLMLQNGLPLEDMTVGLVVLVLAAVEGVVAFRSRSRTFGVSSLLQCLALLTLAVPLLTDRYVTTMSWLALATAMAALAWYANLPSVRVWVGVLLVLSIIRLIAYDQRDLRDVVLTWDGTPLRLWFFAAWGIGVLAHLMAWLRPGDSRRFPILQDRLNALLPQLSPAPPRSDGPVLEYVSAAPAPVRGWRTDGVGIFFTILGTALVALTTASTVLDGRFTVLLLAWTLAVLAVARWDRGLGLLVHGIVLGFIIATAKWFLLDAIAPILRHWTYPHASGIPLLNYTFLAGMMLLGACGLVRMLARREAGRKGIGLGALVVAAIIAFVMINVEACRTIDYLAINDDPGWRSIAIVKHVTLSVLWALGSFACVLLGFRWAAPGLRYAGLMLLAVTLVKIFLVDMAEVRAIWRILSFMVVGALMLGVSYVYNRRMSKDAGEGASA
jgi:uncharacterized membrane protein